MTGVLLAMAILATTEARLEVVEKVNKYREARDIPALAVDDDLMSSAQAWAEHMAAESDFTHSDHGPENIAWGQESINEVLGWWLNSIPHKTQILGNYTATGVGIAIAQSGTAC